jgi:hypothetical protein
MENGKSKRGNSNKKTSIKKINIIRAKFSDITEDYFFESKPIGTGGFGSVYKARHQETGQIRAIKHIELKQNLATVNRESIFYKANIL